MRDEVLESIWGSGSAIQAQPTITSGISKPQKATIKQPVYSEDDTVALKTVSSELGVPEKWLSDVIAFESSWNPRNINPNSGAAGLIQFTNSTASGMGYNSSIDLITKHPDRVSQLTGPVKEYLKQRGPFKNERDFFLSVFYPKGRRQTDDTVLPEQARKLNPGIVTVGDYVKKLKSSLGESNTLDLSQYKDPTKMSDEDFFTDLFGLEQEPVKPENFGEFAAPEVNPTHDKTLDEIWGPPESLAEPVPETKRPGEAEQKKAPSILSQYLTPDPYIKTARSVASVPFALTKAAYDIGGVLPGKIGEGSRKLAAEQKELADYIAGKKGSEATPEELKSAAEEMSGFEAWLRKFEDTLFFGQGMTDEQRAAIQEAKPITSMTADLPAMIVPIVGTTGAVARGLKAAGPVANLLLKHKVAGKAIVDATARGSAFAADYAIRNSEALASEDKEVRNKALIGLSTGVASSVASVGPEMLKSGWYQPVLQAIVGGATSTASRYLMGDELGSKEGITSDLLQTGLGAFGGWGMRKAPLTTPKPKTSEIGAVPEATAKIGEVDANAPTQKLPVVAGRTKFGEYEVDPKQIDGITKLPNNTVTKRHAETIPEENWSASADGDFFKSINDVFGHKEGDKVLGKIGEIASKHFPDEFVGREGGEEFFVDLGPELSEAKIEQVKRFHSDIAENIKLPDGSPFTMSIGVGKGRKTTQGGDLRLVSDIAAYEAKEGGRNQIVVDNGPELGYTYFKGPDIGKKNYLTQFSKKQVNTYVELLEKSGDLDPGTARAIRNQISGEESTAPGGRQEISDGEVNGTRPDPTEDELFGPARGEEAEQIETAPGRTPEEESFLKSLSQEDFDALTDPTKSISHLIVPESMKAELEELRSERDSDIAKNEAELKVENAKQLLGDDLQGFPDRVTEKDSVSQGKNAVKLDKFRANLTPKQLSSFDAIASKIIGSDENGKPIPGFDPSFMTIDETNTTLQYIAKIRAEARKNRDLAKSDIKKINQGESYGLQRQGEEEGQGRQGVLKTQSKDYSGKDNPEYIRALTRKYSRAPHDGIKRKLRDALWDDKNLSNDGYLKVIRAWMAIDGGPLDESQYNLPDPTKRDIEYEEISTISKPTPDQPITLENKPELGGTSGKVRISAGPKEETIGNGLGQQKDPRQEFTDWVKNWFSSKGLNPDEVFKAKTKLHGYISEQMGRAENANVDYQRALKKVYGKAADKTLDEKERFKINQVMRGEAEFSTIPKELWKPLRDLRKQINELAVGIKGSGLVKEGALKDFDVETWLNRSYRVFDDPKYAEKITKETVETTKKFLKTQHEANIDADIENVSSKMNKALAEKGSLEASIKGGKNADTAFQNLEAVNKKIADFSTQKKELEYQREITDEKLMNEINQLLFKNAPATDVLDAMGKMGSIARGILQKRKDIPFEIRALWGEYQDADINAMRSIAKAAHMLGNYRFMNEIKEAGLGKFFFSKDDPNIPSTHYAEIAPEGSKEMEPLAGLLTTPDIAKELNEQFSPKNVEGFLRLWMNAVAASRISKTVLSPATHTTNFFSNILIATANGDFNFGSMRKAVNATINELGKLTNPELRKQILEWKRLGIIGESVNAGELRDLIRDATQTDLDVMLSSGVTGAARKGLKFAGKLYSAGDDFWKINAFLNKKRQYQKADPSYTDEKVAEIIRNTYPTYSRVPRLTKWMRRFPVAGNFVSWPSEIIRTGWGTLRQAAIDIQSDNPEIKKIGMQRAIGILTAASIPLMADAFWKQISGTGLNDKKEKALRNLVPEWHKNTELAILSNKDGKATYLDIGRMDTYSYLKRPALAIATGSGDWEEKFWESMGEIFKPFVGENMVTGALIDIARNEKKDGGLVSNPYGDPVEQAFDKGLHLFEVMAPGAVSTAIRMNKAIQGESNASGVPYSVSNELASLAGARTTTIDFFKSLEFAARKYNSESQNIKAMYRKSNKEPDLSGPESFLKEKIESARTLGMSDAEIRDALKAGGVSSVESAFVETGMEEKILKSLETGKKYNPVDARKLYRQLKEGGYKASYSDFRSRYNALAVSKLGSEDLKKLSKARSDRDKDALISKIVESKKGLSESERSSMRARLRRTSKAYRELMNEGDK